MTVWCIAVLTALHCTVCICALQAVLEIENNIPAPAPDDNHHNEGALSIALTDVWPEGTVTDSDFELLSDSEEDEVFSPPQKKTRHPGDLYRQYLSKKALSMPYFKVH